jgi:hypothetical protein
VLNGLKAEAELKGEGGSSSARIRAFELLGKHLGMFKEQHEHSGPGGGPIPFQRIKRVIVDPAASGSGNSNGEGVPAAAPTGPV